MSKWKHFKKRNSILIATKALGNDMFFYCNSISLFRFSISNEKILVKFYVLFDTDSVMEFDFRRFDFRRF